MAMPPTRRIKRRKTPKTDTGAAVADFLGRRLAGLPAPPRGHYGPVDEQLVADLKRRLASTNGRH